MFCEDRVNTFNIYNTFNTYNTFNLVYTFDTFYTIYTYDTFIRIFSGYIWDSNELFYDTEKTIFFRSVFNYFEFQLRTNSD